jgi:hypothetical protein
MKTIGWILVNVGPIRASKTVSGHMEAWPAAKQLRRHRNDGAAAWLTCRQLRAAAAAAGLPCQPRRLKLPASCGRRRCFGCLAYAHALFRDGPLG